MVDEPVFCLWGEYDDVRASGTFAQGRTAAGETDVWRFAAKAEKGDEMTGNEPLITDMDRFFADSWQEQADGIERDAPAPRSPLMQDLLDHASGRAEYYRERIMLCS